MKNIFTLLLFYGVFTSAQVGIGTATPANSSILDITSDNNDKGILIPRVEIDDLNTQAPITGTMVESLLVYNESTTTGKGFFYWDSSKWVPFTGTSNSTFDPDSFWKTTGNMGTTAGTTAGKHFLGTWDNQDLIIATNTTEKLRVSTNGNVGIGEMNPTKILHLNTDSDGDGLRIEGTSTHADLTITNKIIDLNNQQNDGITSFSFSNSTVLELDNNQMFPRNNSIDNVNNDGFDLGIFNRHFRRVYTQAIHTNDNNANGGLRINIGSTGGTNADYMFSDFAHFPVLDNVKDLGRNGNAWRNLYYQGAFQTSDRRKKKEIKTLNLGVNEILQMKTYQYQYINDPEERTHYGFMAQDLQDQIPALVNEGTDAEKSLAVNYTEIIPILVKAMQEQQKEIEELKLQLQELSKKTD
ncbi:MAG: tail fiber domain-containing protein [Nonlabens sp.]|uniref:tail fiber domain-containing protein n=1 Tax=Nonlabens sp. TaxID=1888209 RepID=UPI003EF3FC81